MDDTQLLSEIRGFNRFYVDIIGLHQRHILGGPFTLAEARILLEVGQNGNNTHGLLRQCLRIDNGYLSRLVSGFVRDGLMTASPSTVDGRSKVLALSEKGKAALAELNLRSNGQIAELIAHLSSEEKSLLAGRFREIEDKLRGTGKNGTTPQIRMFDAASESGTEATKAAGQVKKTSKVLAPKRPEFPTPSLRDISVRTVLRPGDAGRIIALHGEIYAAEYKYDGEFEAYVAKTFYDFLPGYDPARDRVWLVERAAAAGSGQTQLAGCLAVLWKSPDRAQLRWFVLSPELRGMGLGKKLLEEAIAFCRDHGHRRIFLETTADLDAAIHLYTKAGFKMTEEHTEQNWGKILTHRSYEMELSVQ